ncbi:hypothetical protein PG984_015164 [Apiospora sp. TS-2023a]
MENAKSGSGRLGTARPILPGASQGGELCAAAPVPLAGLHAKLSAAVYCGYPRAFIGDYGRYGPAAPSQAAPSRSPDFYAPTYAGPDAVRPPVREETTDSFWAHFSHTKSFSEITFVTQNPLEPGFGPNPGRRVCMGVGLAARGGATGASAAEAAAPGGRCDPCVGLGRGPPAGTG